MKPTDEPSLAKGNLVPTTHFGPKLLILMRHAKSDWANSDQTDHQRPLNGRGREAADRMAEWISAEVGVPDVVLCSSSRRTRETVERMMAIWFTVTEVMFRDELYHAPSPQILKNIVRDGLGAQRLMVVGHNPGMEDLASGLSGKQLAFPTAAVAAFALNSELNWADLRDGSQVRLERLARPKELP